MMPNIRSVLTAATCLAVAGPALAADAPAPGGASRFDHMTLGYTYYNRPGADQKAHDKDVGDCLREAYKVRVFNERTGWGAGYGGVIGATVRGGVTSAEHWGAFAASLENCMVVRGWRVVRVPDAEGAALASLAPADLAQRLTPWIGADSPHGDIARVWDNGATRASNKRNSSLPAHTNDGLLSLQAAIAARKRDAQATPPVTPRPGAIDKKWPRRPLKASQLSSVPPEGGVILIRLKGASLHNGNQILLNRIGAGPEERPSALDHAPDLVDAFANAFRGDGGIYAIAVPAGRWRVYGIATPPAWTVDFCLGSPSFELKSGEVVFAGTFDLASEDLGPELSLEPVKAWLAGQPAAATVRAAEYVNGSLGACGEDLIYALEVKGAPFEPGYAWGAAAPRK